MKNTSQYLCLLLSIFAGVHHVHVHAQEVRPSRSCYGVGQDIVVLYRDNQQPHRLDWIGIYPVNEVDPRDEPLSWLLTCGSLECQGAMNQGNVVFSLDNDINVLDREDRPPPVGVYRAVLSRDDPPDYTFLAVSEVFRVVRNIQECEEPVDDLTTRPPITPAPVTMAPVTTTPIDSNSTRPPTTTPPTTAPATTRMGQIIEAATNDIIALIQETPVLRALYLRMIFHDCVGGACDGCINTVNMDNGGLGSSMNSLQQVVRTYAPDLSRADIWALASFVGVEQAMPTEPGSDRIAMPFQYYGREDCTDRLDRGPDPSLCSPNLGTDDILDYFAREFDFDAKETAAIMGAHTIGIARRNILGFDGPFGWVPNNTRFDNEYYQELVGDGPTAQFHFEHAPQWRQVQVNNTDMTVELGENGTVVQNLPHRWQWEGFPNGRRVIMLNSDIAMVRQLDSANKDNVTGFVSCKFVTRAPGDIVCPVAREGLFSEMVHYRQDNGAFLEDFRDAMIKMTNVGYDIDTASCDEEGNCRLTRQQTTTPPPGTTTTTPNTATNTATNTVSRNPDLV